MLGPMVNPCFPKNQLVGVFNLELARMYGYLYQNTATNFNILHGLDGYDEISLTANTKSISNNKEMMLSAEDFGLLKLNPQDILGGQTIHESAQMFVNILTGNGTDAQTNVVCANAAMAIATANQIEITPAFAMAKKSLQSRKAYKTFEKLKQLSI
jgi:anthranilate phosphoribosyltransferase